MKLSVEFEPIELAQALAAFQKEEKAPEPPVAIPALHVVAFELCTGRLQRNAIAMIKRHRELTGFGLKESKDAIEAAFGAQEWITKGIVQ